MLKCQKVLIKFINERLPQQEIMAEHAFLCKVLEIRRDDKFLTVDHICEKAFSVKQINFNLSDIKEYACEGVLNPSTLTQLRTV